MLAIALGGGCDSGGGDRPLNTDSGVSDGEVVHSDTRTAMDAPVERPDARRDDAQLSDARNASDASDAMRLPDVRPVVEGGASDVANDGPGAPSFTLQLLHASDGEANPAAIDDLPRFAAVLEALRATNPTRTLTLSSGDNWIPGSFLDSQTDPSFNSLVGQAKRARVEVAAMNAMGFQASAFGNHEFDRGATEIFEAIAPSAPSVDAGVVWTGAAFPYLSSNLTFRDDPMNSTTDLASLVVPSGQSAAPGSITKSATVLVDGRRIGVVGVTTPTLGSISSPGAFVDIQPLDSGNLRALAEIVQTEVDALTSSGVGIIVLLAHMQQLTFERQLAPLLRDVDILVGGGSNTILSDATDRLRAGDTNQGTYPEMYTSASGQPMALVNTDGLWKYVGRLVVDFDSSGRLLPSSIQASESGVFATDAAGLAAVPGATLTSPAATRVAELTSNVSRVLIGRESEQFGYTSVYLDGRRQNVRTQETNLGNLTTDAAVWYARHFDPNVAIGIRNSGGVRTEIGYAYLPPGSMSVGDTRFLPPQAVPMAGKEEGEISRFDIETSLSFNNRLVLITLTRAEVKELFEHAFASNGAGMTAAGAFPQVSGVRVSFDASRPVRSRVRSLAIVSGTGEVLDRLVENGVVRDDAERPTIRVATLNFLADCSGAACASCSATSCSATGATPVTCRGGDGYPATTHCLMMSSRVDLFNGTSATLPNRASFAAVGTEQDALAEYLAERFASRDNAYSLAEAPANSDTRLQNLGVREDGVF